jgi:branched-chain amino acid transport system substrate-binding protein
MRNRYLGTLAAAAILAVASPVAAQDITIAVIGPMTGSNASFGEQMKRGAQMATDDLNAKGGVIGKKIKLMIEDDACDPKQAVTAANKAADAKVAAVIGHFCSGSSIPASEVYARKNIIQITPASTNPKLTDDADKKKWKNVHRVCGRDDAQGEVAGKWLAQNFKGKKVAILHDNTPYGKGLADETRKNMEKAGLKAATYEAYKPGEKDYTALVGKLKAGGMDAVYVGGYDPEAALMIRQAHEMGYKPQLISGDALVTDNFWKVSGPAGEGVLMTFSPDPRNIASAKDVVGKFKAQNYDPEGYTLYTYAAIQVWAQAVTQAKDTSVAKVAPVLRSGKPFDTVIGKIALDSKGDVKNPEYVFYKWSNGKYAEIKN